MNYDKTLNIDIANFGIYCIIINNKKIQDYH